MPLYGTIVIIKRTGVDGSKYPLTVKQCLIGSADRCDIHIRLPSVAPEHCELVVSDAKEVLLKNMASDEPSVLNGQDLPVGEAKELKHGDVFTVSDRSFRFECAPQRRRGSVTVAASGEVLERTTERVTPGKSQDQNGLSSGGASMGQKACSKTPNLKNESPHLWPPQKKENQLASRRKTSFTRIPKLAAAQSSKTTVKGKVYSSRIPTPAVAKSAPNSMVKSAPKATPVTLPTRNISKRQTSTKKALFTPSPKVLGVSKLFQEIDRNSPKLAGLAELVEEPEVQGSWKQKEAPQLLEKDKPKDSPKLVAASRLFRDQKVTNSPKLSGVAKLLRESKIQKSPRLGGVSKLFQEVGIQKTPKLAGVSRMLRNSKLQTSPRLDGMSQLFRSDKPIESPKLVGIRRLMEEQDQKLESSPDLVGVSQLFKEVPTQSTARRQQKPAAQEDVENRRVSRLFRDEKVMNSPDLTGVAKSLRESKVQKSPRLEGVSKLFQEVRIQRSPKLAGISKMLRESKPQTSPRLGGMSRLFRSGRAVESPKLVGVRRLMEEHDQKLESSPDLVGVSKLFKEASTRGMAKCQSKPAAQEVDLVPNTGRVLRKKGRAVGNMTPELRQLQEAAASFLCQKTVDRPKLDENCDSAIPKERTNEDTAATSLAGRALRTRKRKSNDVMIKEDGQPTKKGETVRSKKAKKQQEENAVNDVETKEEQQQPKKRGVVAKPKKGEQTDAKRKRGEKSAAVKQPIEENQAEEVEVPKPKRGKKPMAAEQLAEESRTEEVEAPKLKRGRKPALSKQSDMEIQLEEELVATKPKRGRKVVAVKSTDEDQVDGASNNIKSPKRRKMAKEEDAAVADTFGCRALRNRKPELAAAVSADILQGGDAVQEKSGKRTAQKTATVVGKKAKGKETRGDDGDSEDDDEKMKEEVPVRRKPRNRKPPAFYGITTM